jgi:hypothetical protein
MPRRISKISRKPLVVRNPVLAPNGYTLLATSSNFTVTAINVVLTVSPVSVAPGGNVSAEWTGIPAPTATDWLGCIRPPGPTRLP